MRHDESRLPIAIPAVEPATGVAQDLRRPQPLDVLLRRALDVNPTVRAARFNVLALQHRIPQVTALDDPILSNTIFPIPSVAPQYSLMGYMPYAVLLAQQFPWCGTLRLRGWRPRTTCGSPFRSSPRPSSTSWPASSGRTTTFTSTSGRSRSSSRTAGSPRISSRSPASGTRPRRPPRPTSSGPRWPSATSTASSRRPGRPLVEARSELARLLHVDPETPLQTVPDLPVEAVPRGPRAAGPARDRQPSRASRAARRDRPRPRRPSSSPASGTIPTSPSAWSIRTWRRPTP